MFDGSHPVGNSGKAGTLGRILASHSFREVLVGKDQLDRLEVIRGINDPLVYCSEGLGQQNSSFGGLIEKQAGRDFMKRRGDWTRT